MRILFICTAFNSLSQRLALVLKDKGHAVTVELAISAEVMIAAAELAQPDIIVCPFLTKRVPREVYTRWLTLIVHPGPPHDAGPSALDFAILGDDGSSEDAEAQLVLLDDRHAGKDAKPTMRSHWGLTVLQAIEQFDAGPIWAFDQFALDAETRTFTKSDLYRGPVTRAAVTAVLAAVERITAAASKQSSAGTFSVDLTPPPTARELCVSSSLPFQGGPTRDRPLLKASARDFVHLANRAQNSGHKLNAEVLVQRINCGDSQPGVLSSIFGAPLFLYDACVQSGPMPALVAERATSFPLGTILAKREGAVLINAGADKPIWIAHVRKPKAKADRYLAPKLPAVQGLLSIESLAKQSSIKQAQEWPLYDAFGQDGSRPWAKQLGTYQQVWVELETISPQTNVGYVYFEFYNGATATEQCKLLLQAIEWTLRQPDLKAIVLMGGAGYFSNGIALNVIEGAADPSAESWFNINAIDDCVRAVLAPSGILTFAAIRANCAAGGLALATACDIVLCAESAVLNPHYRGLGLYGSEYHTYSWYERCGSERAANFARTMLPLSSTAARDIGLVDVVLGQGTESPSQLEAATKATVARFMRSTVRDAQKDASLYVGAPWTKPLLRKQSVQPDQQLADYYLSCKHSYLTCLFASRQGEQQGRVMPTFAECFAIYRKAELDNMVLDFFHPVRGERYASRRLAFVRKLAASKTPARFALHRRFGSTWSEAGPNDKPLEQDEEELDSFDGIGDIPAQVAFDRLNEIMRAQVNMQRSISNSTVDSSTSSSEVPELAAHSARPSPPETPQPSSPKGALDLQAESLAASVPVPVLVHSDSLKAGSFSTLRASSISFVPAATVGGSGPHTPESAPRTAKVTRLQNGKRPSRPMSSFNFAAWGGKKDTEGGHDDLSPSTEAAGLAVVNVLPSSSPHTRSRSSSAASRLFSSLARKSKKSLSNLSHAFEGRSHSTSGSERDSRQPSEGSVDQGQTGSEGKDGAGPSTSDTSTPAPAMIYTCYYNSDDTPRPAHVAT